MFCFSDRTKLEVVFQCFFFRQQNKRWCFNVLFFRQNKLEVVFQCFVFFRQNKIRGGVARLLF